MYCIGHSTSTKPQSESGNSHYHDEHEHKLMFYISVGVGSAFVILFFSLIIILARRWVNLILYYKVCLKESILYIKLNVCNFLIARLSSYSFLHKTTPIFTRPICFNTLFACP